ncbi:zinc-binding dehydrogenase [Bradyrhizobium sp. CCGUVB1N3]|uniref:zinc-binding dehydrogenase n=1 Tax=Bradyrhizobium sp. CCGUVB1N3 TaxID=2949629 RepID=UPI0020B2D84A|nr:zinc-binding dehydrogenase [Bradyrhizobium sp. CCGUVB1N3]MCP3476760.1 zinc-binding dehydrogenase [Bradyrhizobium sp. CCGUVB1N3]
MRAIVSSADGPVLRDIPRPIPGPEEVLVQVKASSLNRADLAMLKGAAHGRVGGMGSALGLELAGEVVEVGKAVKAWRVGDRVMAGGGGAFAEYAAPHASRIYAVPKDLSFEQASALPVALQTMHDAIVTNGMFEAGQAVLIQGASSGVGLMGLQVAKYLRAGLVIGTSTSALRRARLEEFGADLAVDSRAPDWVAQVLEATGGKGVDLLIDFVAGPLMNGNLQATRIGGRIVNVGRLAGNSGEVDFDLHSMRRITYVGVTFRTRTAGQVGQIVERATRALGPALTSGALQLPIDQVFRLEEASHAFERMARNEHFGKIVLTNA